MYIFLLYMLRDYNFCTVEGLQFLYIVLFCLCRLQKVKMLDKVSSCLVAAKFELRKKFGAGFLSKILISINV